MKRRENMSKSVKVYSTPTCPFCIMLKNFLKEKNIQFEDFDVSKDREKLIEMKQKSGQMGVPVIDIDGKIIVGFDREAISKELGV
jgi:glutaredoxin-like YruB-family protein